MNSNQTSISAFIGTLEETKSISSGWPEFFFVKVDTKQLVHWPFQKETGAFKGKLACKLQAEKTMRSIYDQANQKYIQAQDDVLANYMNNLTEQLAHLASLLELCRTAENESNIASIRVLLQPEQIRQNLGRIHAEIKERYELPSLSGYLEQIEYTQHSQEGLAQSDAERIFERMFRRYGFNALDAAHKIDQDCRDQLQEFRKEFLRRARLQVVRSIVEPVRRLLPEPALHEEEAS